MIYIRHREIYSIFMQSKTVQAVYKGARLVWQAIRSCFGGGYWDDNKPWLDDEGWKD